MHLRKLTLVIGVLGALSANWTFGLGLGEITVDSSLDEPLKAEIKLLQVRDLVPEEIIVELAAPEDFDRAGVERIYFLQDLKFQVELNNPGGPVVKVTSERPVREPYLNFLVKTQWPSGRLLREYTVLLDIPVFTSQPATPVRPAQTQPQQPVQPVQPAPRAQPRPEPTPVQPTRPQTATPSSEQEPPRATPAPTESEPEIAAPTQPAPVEPSRPSSTFSSDEYGPVQANDTLWEIALQVRPDRSVSVQQTMLALQRLNPDAFINNNINLLKKGQVLRVPSQSEITSMAQSEAVSEVAYQNSQWSGRSQDQVGAQLEGARTRPQVSTPTSEPQGQLTLAAPGDSRDAGAASGAGDTGQQAALENELAISMEELDSARRESGELNERVSELDEQIDTIERLLEVSNAELANLQQAADQVSEAGADTTGALDTSDTEATPTDESADPAVAEDPAATEEPVVAEQPEVAPKPQIIRPPVVEKSLVDTLMDYIWYIVAALAIILGGVFIFLQRRAHRQMEEFDSFEDDGLYNTDTSSSDDFSNLNDSDFDADEFDLADDEPLEEFEPAAPQPTKSETGDAVAEADIYIAYGKFDQAEDMLTRAIDEQPNNAEARLKLLEVYAETKNTAKFDAAYGELLALGNNSVNQRAADLRSSIPGIGAYAAAQADDSAALDFDTDLSFDDAELSAAPAPSQSDTSGDDDNFNFDDLSFDLEDKDTSRLDLDSSAASDTASESDAIDFDFDLEESDEGVALSDGDDDNARADTMEFNLDFDGDDETTIPTTKTSTNDELSLDLDLDDEPLETAESDDFSFDLEDDTATGDDVLSDLEFSPSSETKTPATNNTLDFELDSDDASGDLDDAFDMDMDDVDLAALDEEMDALVGGIDEIEDAEVRVAPTEALPELGADDLEGLELDDDLGGSEDTTDLDDLISLDDSSLDDLSFDTDTPAKAAPADDPFAGFDSDSDGDEDLDSELDFLSDTDEVATKLDLARAYIDMGDKEGAKDILDEVISEGNPEQKVEAQELLGRM